MPNAPKLKPAEVDAAYASAQKVVQMHQHLSQWLRIGMTLAQVDAEVARVLASMGAKSCFLGYQVPRSPQFPSHACLSLNECVVHGTAGYYTAPMKVGDVLKVDIGVMFRGWVGDAAWTYSIGQPTPQIRRLMDSGKVSLRKGIEAIKPGNRYLDWAIAVQDCVESEYGFRCIESWGGHGYGRKLHEAPHLLNHRPRFPGEWPEASAKWEPGVLVAVEPMIAISTGATYQKEQGRYRDWPVYTQDGSMSVHYEHDVLVTPEGNRVLTEGLDELNDVIDS